MDKRAFILGMITAFSECVAGGCKKLALSPPLSHEDYEMIHEEAVHTGYDAYRTYFQTLEA